MRELGDIGWFITMASLATLAWGFGYHVASRYASRAWVVLVLGVVLLGTSAWLSRHPAVALQIVPVEVLRYIEGVAPVPAFMLIVGVIFGRGRVPRERRVAAWATMLGAVYFLQGGFWMIETVPRAGLAEAVERGPVRQSQAYSCVPASCATALNLLGVYTSEAEMARLTGARPGVGATPVRALYGLNQRLESTRYRFELVEAPAHSVRYLPMPALTPLQFEPTRRHMVTLTQATDFGIWIEDPIDGTMFMDWATFDNHYTGELLVHVVRR